MFDLTSKELPLTVSVTAVDENQNLITKNIACERPLTIYLNWQPIVTLMTLGANPKALAIGYLKNQGIISQLDKIDSIILDWEVNSIAIVTTESLEHLSDMLAEKTVTSGCGQGTAFGNFTAGLDKIEIKPVQIKQSTIYSLLTNITNYNETYKNAGAVHGCAICAGADIVSFYEDVGRHNAVDTLAGVMWVENQVAFDKIFYTTGRLTSEMIIKIAKMGVPTLLSRSGITQMGLELAQKLNITIIARAKGRHFLIYHGAENVDFSQ